MGKHEQTAPPTRLIPANEWNKHHAWPPAGGLRHLIFNERRNGFSTCVKRVGRRVLIDEAAFFAWVDEQSAAARRALYGADVEAAA